MATPRKHLWDLYTLFASVKNEKEAELLLKDIVAPQELASLAERWQLVQQIHAGKPQRDIAKNLGVSFSKITRGSKAMQESKGGFGLFLKRFKK